MKFTPCNIEDATIVKLGNAMLPIDEAGPDGSAFRAGQSLVIYEDAANIVPLTEEEVKLLERLGALEFLKPREPKTVTVEAEMVKTSGSKGFRVNYTDVYEAFEPGDKFNIAFTEILGGADEN